MENWDKILQEKVQEIRGQEIKILDDFCKAYIASEFLNGRDMKWMMKHLQLNKQMTNQDGKIGYRYWYSIIDEEL